MLVDQPLLADADPGGTACTSMPNVIPRPSVCAMSVIMNRV
jgi:hypothetical protein